MILSPLQNTINFLGRQIKPIITQGFGENPHLYKQFGWRGHEGIDFRAIRNTPIFSPIDGTVTVIDSEDKGYGLHVIIQNNRLRITLAHLNAVSVHTGQVVGMGEPIGKTGNTGNSTAPHLHMTVQKFNGTIVLEKRNGYGGGQDVTQYILNWMGTFTKETL